MFTSFGKFLSGIVFAITSIFTPSATTTPTVYPASVSATTSIDIPTTAAPTVAHVPAPVVKPTTQPVSVPAPVIPVVQVPETQVVSGPTAPATTQYYENGQYVELTDAEHKHLLSQKEQSILDSQAKEKSYVTDAQKIKAEEDASCSSVTNTAAGYASTGTSVVAEGNADIALQAGAARCSATIQAYAPALEADNQAIQYYEDQIASLRANYN